MESARNNALAMDFTNIPQINKTDMTLFYAGYRLVRFQRNNMLFRFIKQLLVSYTGFHIAAIKNCQPILPCLAFCAVSAFSRNNVRFMLYCRISPPENAKGEKHE